MSESVPSQHYQVLARKYRPATFEDMIGQEAMVTTLTNAFKAGRVAHAFMLTGVRGIGKTTTARLLARALNYETEAVQTPSVDLATLGRHCERIMSSSHMDVLEMDAASRTGVENMREMLDGVRYAPVEARYKVYIIDEVHMLSTGAFNALLKTLEEPPDHAKFIFATTEIRKVPITVLSRCQRFDLRRVEASALQAHLKGICTHENVSVSDDGLALIARAAEGSVRDSLSLLDQAIVQAGLDGGEVSAEQVRAMLGLADRVRVLDLFEKAVSGDGAGALIELGSQYDDGADPAIIMRDLLDICHEVTRAQALGDRAEFELAPEQGERIKALADTLSTGQLTRIWQMLLKAHQDVRLAPVPLAAAEMALLKLAVAGELPPPEWVAKLLEEMRNGNVSAPVVSAPTENPAGGSPADGSSGPGMTVASTPVHARSDSGAPTSSAAPQTIYETAPVPNPVKQQASVELPSLEALVELLKTENIGLASNIKRYVRPIAFKPGRITFEPAKEAPTALTGQIVSAIKDLTGELWIVSPETSGGGETLREQEKREALEQDARDKSHPAFSHPLLEKAKLIGITDTAPEAESNVISGDFNDRDEDRD